MKSKHIVIFSDTDGLHEGNLSKAFKKQGVSSSRVSLMDCQLNYGENSSGLLLPGMHDTLPAAAFVRAIPDGSFEQVTFRLDILHALEASGVLVYNTARAIERTVDKGMTSFLLARDNIPSPSSWVCESAAEAQKIIKKETRGDAKLVLKPLFGNCGRGLQLLDRSSAVPSEEEVDGVYYLQKQILHDGPQARDWRVLVIADRAIAAMERISDHWITNRARGGKCLPAVLTPEIRELAEAASHSVGTAYAGVDIIRDTDGKYLVLEVNSVPAWRGLQSVVEKDICQLLADDLLRRCGSTTGAAMTPV
ncbi:MAG: RimK family alpha-L-glutamate ligase [Gammaproteobacteria bacterium]|nr:RimK family alpha-L-glutamate ligase [Gammaproteobacteria bacterium]